MNVIYKDEYTSIIQSLKRSKSPENINDTVVKFYDRISGRIDAIVTNKQLNLACKKGCCYCCYLRVEVRAHEVFTISRFIHQKRSVIETKQLIDRLRSTVNASGSRCRLINVTVLREFGMSRCDRLFLTKSASWKATSRDESVTFTASTSNSSSAVD